MTGIFFGSTMGTTEAVAADIAKQLGVADADVHNVADTPAGEVQKYDLLVLGSSTWGAGELQDDWYGFLDQLKCSARCAGLPRAVSWRFSAAATAVPIPIRSAMPSG